MLTTIQDARRRKRPALNKFEKAFGKNADINVVEDRIRNMQNTPLRVFTANPIPLQVLEAERARAENRPQRDKMAQVNSLVNDDVLVGTDFYSPGMDRTLRGHALIHEAAHQQFYAGDDIDKTANRVVRYRETPPAGNKIDVQAGCKFHSNVPF
jgi:hypothetical protein